jgi:hypothetical protein
MVDCELRLQIDLHILQQLQTTRSELFGVGILIHVPRNCTHVSSSAHLWPFHRGHAPALSCSYLVGEQPGSG